MTCRGRTTVSSVGPPEVIRGNIAWKPWAHGSAGRPGKGKFLVAENRPLIYAISSLSFLLIPTAATYERETGFFMQLRPSASDRL